MSTQKEPQLANEVQHASGGLITLAQLVQDLPEVRGALSGFRSSLQIVFEKHNILHNYKRLHDLLQALEDSFRPIFHNNQHLIKARRRAPEQRDHSKLLQQLEEAYSDDELQELCFELDIDYENLPGETKRSKARQLIQYCKRRRQLNELAALHYRLRPHLLAQLDQQTRCRGSTTTCG
jgi:hypothetical protein